MEDQNQFIEKKTVLVTGGAGYVGSILLRHLLHNDYKVVCVDCLRYGGSSLIDIWGNPDFAFEKVDITNFNDVDDIFHRYDFNAVVHLAAIVGDPACRLEPDLARKTNWDASTHLLEMATQFRVLKFVFASTCSNYGRMEDTDDYVSSILP